MALPRAVALFTLACALSNVFADPPGSSDGPYDLQGIQSSVPPKIDGELAPGEWPADARKEGFVDKETNTPSDDPAEFWVTYDKEAIYFAARIRTDPKKIVADEYRPNTSFNGDDNVAFGVDPVSTGAQGNVFATNSRGATSIQLAGGRAAKTEWLGEIQASGKQTADGWQCEMRIPWGVMNLPAAGRKDIPWNVFWYRSVKQNTFVYKYFSNDPSKLPLWKNVDVPAVEKSREFKLLPYIYGGYGESEKHIANAGLDFKTGVTDSLTFVGTVNPDFRNIETSVLSLDHSHFERLAGESRPFFQEGAGYLLTGHDQRLFASQRIKNIDGGAKVYGQVSSKMSLGFLTTFDFGKQRATALSTVYRLTDKQDVSFAYVGNDQPGLRNDALQLNYSQRIGPWMAYFNNQGTHDQVKDDGWRNSTGFMYNKDGLVFGAEHNYVSPGFFPRLGFSPEQDLKGVNVYAEIEKTPTKGPFTTWNVGVNGATFNRTNGSFYRDETSLEFMGALKSKWAFGGSVTHSKFLGSNDRLYVLGIGQVGDPNRGVALNYSWGEYGGDKYENIDFEFSYRPTKTSQIEWNSQFLDFQGSHTQHVIGLRYDIGQYESVGGRAVYEDGDWNWYLSYRMSGRRGVEYYVLVGDPQAGSFQNRLVIKAVIPISIKY